MVARYRIFLCIVFFFNNSFVKPPLESLIDSSFTCTDHDTPLIFNPLCGTIAAEGDTLKNIWLYGDTSTAMVQLLKTLFIVEEDKEFLTTTYTPYHAFTPETIAHFIAKIYNKTLYDKDERGNVKALQEINKTFKGSKYRMLALVDLIKAAHQEDDGATYPAQTIYEAFLAFLYIKAEHIDDLYAYTKHLSSLFTTLPEKSTMPFVKIGSHHIQKIIDTTYKLPYRVPKATWARKIAYKDYKPISDCCETAIRGFLNELLYDPITETFMISRLRRPIQEKIHDSIKNFYNTHSQAATTDGVNNQALHKEWLEIVSNMPELEYRKEHYEIEPCLQNLMYTIGLLCGIKANPNRYLYIGQYVMKLCKKLSNPALFTITVETVQGRADPDVDAFFILKHTNPTIPVNYFALHVRKNHAWITQIA